MRTIVYTSVALTSIALRAVRSGLQASLGVLVATGTEMISLDALQVAGVAALVAETAALQNSREQVEI